MSGTYGGAGETYGATGGTYGLLAPAVVTPLGGHHVEPSMSTSGYQGGVSTSTYEGG